MGAGKFDFTEEHAIEQGATFTKRITWENASGTPIDLTDYSAKMQIRLTKNGTDVLVDLGTDAEIGGITLGGAAGTIDLEISAEDTAALNFDAAVYDLELISPTGVVTRLLEGSIALSKEVTKDES